MTTVKHAPDLSGSPEHHAPEVRREGTLWLVAFLAIAGATVARLPYVHEHVAQRVDDAIRAGQLVDTDQRDLAVNIAVAGALAVSICLTVVVLAVARRMQPRLRLPAPRVAGRVVPGVLVLVGSVMVTKQIAALLTGTTAVRTDPIVWTATLCVMVAASVVVLRAGDPASRARTLLVSLVAGAVALVV